MHCERISLHIVDWMKKYLDSSAAKGFVVGVSGGVDSALVSTLCAMTGKPTLCVTLPIHQAKSHVSRAEEHCSWLKKKFENISVIDIDLSSSFDLFSSQMPVCEDKKLNDLCLANTRSRLRMTSLYHCAGVNGYLVAGTGNKIEDFGVGFFTKWGDGAVDISPIGDLTKTEVFDISKYLGVCESIINAEPSDGLFDQEQTDQMQIGASYPELEWAMGKHARGLTESDFSGDEARVMRIYRSRHDANAHKMNPIPVCVIPNNIKEEL